MTANREPAHQQGNIIPFPLNSAPYSEESEESVVGAVIVNPNAYKTVAHILSSNDFFFVRYGVIWQGIENLANRDEAIDPVTLTAELQSLGALEESGGLAHFIELARNVPTSTHIEIYATLVKRASVRRQIIQHSEKLRAMSMDETVPLEQIATQIEVIEQSYGSSQMATILTQQDIADSHHAMITGLADGTLKRGIKTGIPEFDNTMGGMRPATVAYFVGSPENGKSSILQTIALNVAASGEHVVFINVGDQDELAITTRIISMMSAMPQFNSSDLVIPAFNLGEGRLSKDQWRLYVDLLEKFNRLPLHIDSTIGASPGYCLQYAQQIKRQHGLSMVIIDYYQRMRIESKSFSCRREELEHISQALIKMAKRENLNAPVLIGAQASSDVVQRQDRMPGERDIKDCKAAAEDATIMIGLLREYMVAFDQAKKGVLSIKIVKNKQSGVARRFSLRFDPATTQVRTNITR